MNNKILMAILMSFMMTVALISCGGDGGDGGGGKDKETNTTGSTGTTGTTGTSPQNEEPAPETCLSTARVENIRTFFGKISGREISGSGHYFDSDDRIDFDTVSLYRFTQQSSNFWRLNGTICEAANPTNCVPSEGTFEIRSNGCFFVDGAQVQVTSSSNSSLSYSLTGSGETISESGSITNDRLHLLSTKRRNGETVARITFDEERL